MDIDTFKFVQPLLQWIAAHPTGAGLIVFLTAFSESLAFVGIIFPGAVMMFGFGAIIATGAMSLWPILIYAVIGAILGDVFSFWLGRHFQDRLRMVWPFRRYPELLTTGVEFFQRHGGKSILFGRFIGPVRPVIPIVAGMLRMHSVRFIAADMMAALAWGPAYILPGVVFGASLNLAAEVASRLVILLMGLVGTVWFILFTVHRLFWFLQPRAKVLLNVALTFNARHPKFGQLGNDLLDPNRSEARTLFTLGILLVGCTFLFAKILAGMIGDGSNLDRFVYYALQDLRTPWGDDVLIAVTELGDLSVMLILVGTVLTYLLWRGRFLAAGYWCAVVTFGTLMAYLFKLILQIPRPVTDLYRGIDSFSFPSMHSTGSTVVFGFLVVLVAQEIRHTTWRWVPYVMATGLVLAIAFSRIYLGAHWLSDVIAGLSLGVIWVALLGIAYRHHRPPPISLVGLGTTVFLTLILAGTWHIVRSHESDRGRYAREDTSHSISAETWWSEGWHDSSWGNPINFQWAGHLEYLQERLVAAGWQIHPTLSMTNLLRIIAPNPLEAELPLIPQLLNGRTDALHLIFLSTLFSGEGAEKLPQWWVLRLWSSGVRLIPSETPVWIGYVNCLETWHPIPWITLLRASACFRPAQAVLEFSLAGLELRTVHHTSLPMEAGEGFVLLARR